MTKLENFVGMMTGHFDNKDQFDKMHHSPLWTARATLEA